MKKSLQLLTIRPPVLCKNQGFIKAGELVIGYELLNSNCNVLLVENFDVELTDEPTTVYNFQVEDFHTYHVGKCRLLVHNAGDAYKRPSGYRKGVRDKTWEEAKANSPD
ncbi:polymorphic toxin-type HINT domain-containing protein, partial [Ruminococcus bicirculans (ex Wegman et al. 2014)]